MITGVCPRCIICRGGYEKEPQFQSVHGLPSEVEVKHLGTGLTGHGSRATGYVAHGHP